MLKNKLIIIPIEGDWNHSADFLRQTALNLSLKNQVVIYDQENSYFFLKRKKEIIYPKHKNIYFHQVKYFLPLRRFAFLEKINRQLSFKLFLKKNREKEKIVWVFYPNYFDLARIKDKKKISIYDCVDYNHNHKKETKLIQDVDYFFVNSKSLKKLHRSEIKKPIYIDSQGFFEPDTKLVETVQLDIKKPIIGFVGGINYRLDFKLINQLVKNNQNWQFIFYGPRQIDIKKDKAFKTEYWINQLKKYKNIFFDQSSNRYKVYGIIKNFDIAIIPYNTNILFNKYCYPMKVFEYFYFGKPVISTKIEELELDKFKKFVRIAKTSTEWEKSIEFFLKNKFSSKQIKKLKELSIENNWQRKIEKISEYLKKYD